MTLRQRLSKLISSREPAADNSEAKRLRESESTCRYKIDYKAPNNDEEYVREIHRQIESTLIAVTPESENTGTSTTADPSKESSTVITKINTTTTATALQLLKPPRSHKSKPYKRKSSRLSKEQIDKMVNFDLATHVKGDIGYSTDSNPVQLLHCLTALYRCPIDVCPRTAKDFTLF